jgi:PAS domain S-box-containing protein
MTFPDPEIIAPLMHVLNNNPRGITISGIAIKTRMNRNLIAKYLDHLLVSGQLERKKFGSSKIYSLASRIPVSSLMNHSFDPVIILDHEQRILNVNDPLLSLLAEKPENLVGKKISSIHNPDLAVLLRNALPETPVEHPGEVLEVVATVRGNPLYFSIRTIPVVYEDGKSGTAVIFHDTSSEKKYQLIKDLDQARQDSISEDQAELVIRFLPDGTLTYLNTAAVRFFRKKPGEGQDLNIRSVILIEDHPTLDHVLRAINKENPVRTIRCRIINPSGQVRYFGWTLRGLYVSENTVHEFHGVGTDITELQDETDKKNQLIDDQALLYQMSCEFSAINRDANIYEMIGHGVREIIPTAIVGVNSFEVPATAVRTQCFLGEREREIFSHFLGEDIVGHVIEAPETVERNHIIQNVMAGKLFKVPGNLYVTMMGQIPFKTCEKIEQSLNIGDIYIMGLVSGNQLFGNIGLFTRKGETLKRQEILEIFIRHATLALKCRYLDEGREIPIPPGNGY